MNAPESYAAARQAWAERNEQATDEYFLEQFRDSIRRHLSPDAVATIIAFLQPAALKCPPTPEAQSALVEVEWFSEFLTEMVGVDEVSRIFEELSL